MSAMVGLNIWRRLTLLLFAAASARAVVSIEKKSEFRFPAVENSQGDQLFEYYADRAGQVEYDPLTKQLWVVGKLEALRI